MTGHRSFVALPISILLICLLGVCGCNRESQSTPEDQDVKVVTVAEQKAELLKQLDKRFQNADAHYELAKLYDSEGAYDQARFHYENALRFDPAHRLAQGAYVRFLMDRKEDVEAQTKAALYMEQVSSSYDETLKLARALKVHGAEVYALAAYQQALQIEPESAEIFKDLGFHYLDKGDKELAKSYLTRSFQIDSNQPDVAGELGRLGVEVKMPEPPEKEPSWWRRVFKKKEKEPEQE